MRESELLAHIYERSVDLGEDVPVGPGDDAAVVRIGRELALVTVDQLIEGRHYEPGTCPSLIANKAMGRSVSDIAAMAGRPRFALAAASIGPGCEDADALFEAMKQAASEQGAALVGGDIAATPGPTTLTVTVVGEPHAKRGPVLRSWARAGDHVFVTGTIGGAVRSGKHLRFTPRVQEATEIAGALGENLRAMIDLSDGLGRDAGRVAAASGVRLEIEAGLIPLSDGAGDVRSSIAEGEDYELLFTASATEAPHATRIGRVVEGEGAMMILEDGQTIDIGEEGWDHE